MGTEGPRLDIPLTPLSVLQHSEALGLQQGEGELPPAWAQVGHCPWVIAPGGDRVSPGDDEGGELREPSPLGLVQIPERLGYL